MPGNILGAVIIICFGIIVKVLEKAGIDSLNALPSVTIDKLLGSIGRTLLGTFVAILLNSLFEFTGVNSGQVVGSVMKPIWLQLPDANRVAAINGEPLPNIITQQFVGLFVYMDGGGAKLNKRLTREG